jgi:Fe-Mn family superoxide dismutase
MNSNTPSAQWIVSLKHPLKAFEPHISERTMDRHYNAHYATYVKNLESLITADLRAKSLQEVVRSTHGIPDLTKIYNNAGQIFNHNQFWSCLCPTDQYAPPSSRMHALIDAKFGSLDALIDAVVEIGCGQFGSGWVWLTGDGKTPLKVCATGNADSPSGGGAILACIDVWEHAYYLDYQQDRRSYIRAVAKNLWDWRWIEQCYNSC